MVAVGLACGWAWMVMRFVERVGRRFRIRHRADALSIEAPKRDKGAVASTERRRLPGAFVPFVHVAEGIVRRYRDRCAAKAVEQQFALAIDLIGVAVNSGATALHAVEVAALWSPSHVAKRLAIIANTARLGVPFAEALTAEALRTPTLRPLTEALGTAHRLGSPLGPALKRIADEARAAERRRAEARARTVPVRLLFPLVFLVLPAFGLLTVVPALVAGWHGI